MTCSRLILLMLLMQASMIPACALEANKPSTVVPADEIVAKIENGVPVDYINITINGDLNLDDLSRNRPITSNISIFNSIIEGDVNCKDIIFQKPVNFKGSKFNKNASFDGSHFRASAYFGRTEFNGSADFVGCEINGTASFMGSKFMNYANFTGSCLNNSNFLNSIFNGSAFFQNQYFDNFTSFDDSTFIKEAHFDRSIFSSTANFPNVTFSSSATFMASRFKGNAIYKNVSFESGNFEGSCFEQSANFKGARFKYEAQFKKSQFHGDASFQDARFNGKALFPSFNLSGDASFSNSSFYNYSEFDNAIFQKNARFKGALFNRAPSFSGVTFQGISDFSSCTFHDAALHKERLRISTSFRHDLNRYLHNIGLSCENKSISAIFKEAKFRKEANFRGVESDHLIDFNGAQFDMLAIRWDNVYPLQSENLNYYPKFIANYRNISWFDDATDCYYDYRRQIRIEEPTWPTTRAVDILADISYGYGVKPHYAIIFSMLIIVIFGCHFWRGEDRLKRSILRSIWFSLNVFLSGTKFLGFEDVEGPPNHMRAYHLEKWLGLILQGLLFLAITNSMLEVVKMG